MMKTVLVAATAALFAGAASADVSPALRSSGKHAPVIFRPRSGEVTLYDQNFDDSGQSFISMNFDKKLRANDSQGADDFIVPVGETWTVTEVDVTGNYSGDQSQIAKSEDVYFYNYNHFFPGRKVDGGVFKIEHGQDNGGSFAIRLRGGGVKLPSGHYFVSVVANLIGGGHGTSWFWELKQTQVNTGGAFRNEGGGLQSQCDKWGNTQYCLSVGPDWMFALQGTKSP